MVRACDVISNFLNYHVALSRHRNALLPVFKLPQELLETIFEFACLPNDNEKKNLFFTALDDKLESSAPPDRPVTPLLIASVCHAWRNVVMNAPQLWSNIQIIISDKHAEKQAEKLRYWLSKSRRHCLTVALIADEDEDEEITSTAVIDVVAAHANRLHSFHVHFFEPWRHALLGMVNSLHQLVHFTLQAHRYYGPHVHFTFCTPQLQGFNSFGFDVPHVALPWTRIEHLDVCCKTKAEYFSIFQHCPRLRKFTCRLQLQEDQPPFVPSAMTPGSLEVLELQVITTLDLKHCLEPLTLPMLRSFSLQVTSNWPASKTDLPISSLLPFIVGSKCILETLSLVCAIPSPDLAEYLHALPSLRHLLLFDTDGPESGNYFDQRLLDLMNPKNYLGLEGVGPLAEDSDWMNPSLSRTGIYVQGSPTCLGANLETIFFQGELFIDTLHDLVEFLAYRWYGTSAGPVIHEKQAQTFKKILPINPVARKLQSATFNASDFRLEKEDVNIVQKLCSEGMHVELVLVAPMWKY
ncbi:hypothetical protein BDN70DRAFT_989447 [Pholiota conissans]|uniref:F-box domain-containing protein n=1 Tax=Pholiota conissans TaxID=109636 RepID=A0A9P5ZEP9_9AGAR|nr:hypothetical protein BDN70DRAFT_989447 [Pholiota conissans]